tara:strand:+ start:111 stop:1343 length:1233 start_codon:yes stop_codon:yes gene_type:complete
MNKIVDINFIMNKIIKKELRYGAKNYLSKKVCITKGSGIYLTDVNNKQYLDFISAYSAVNQGHCHPKLIEAATRQMSELTLTSRALYNNKLGDFMEKMCQTFKYEKVLPMNTGVEGGETAIKISRKWGYEVKHVDSAINLFCENNFWGRTLAAVSSSTDKSCYENFGPYMNGFHFVKYNCIESLEDTFMKYPNIVSFMLEPIQGEAGIIIPDAGYLTKVRELCDKYNVLMIADEVQTGMGRTGKMLCCDHENVQPDILILGKALSGGMMPISAVLANHDIMDVITPGTHGSTFGGNPLAAAIGIEAIDITLREELSENANVLGEYFLNNLKEFTKDIDFVVDVRGKGLMNAIELNSELVANDLIAVLKNNGLLAKTTHENIVRLAPPLIITKNEINQSLDIIKKSIDLIS